jgi:CcmD family protein
MKPIVSISTFVLTTFAGVSMVFAQTSAAAKETTIPGGTLAIAAYVVLWVLIFGFVFLTMRRQQRLDRDLSELERRMDEVFDDLNQS